MAIPTRVRKATRSTLRAPLATLGAVAIALAVAPLVAASPAGAQVADAWMHATPIDALLTWPSARLDAMGDLHVATEDRLSRLNAYEYGRNPAGLLSARDTSWVEEGSHYEDFNDHYYGEDHSAVHRKTGIRGAVNQGNWALGVDFVYGSVTASRHDAFGTPDNARFIRDFDIPFATTFQSVTTDRTIGATTSFPAVAVTYARRFLSWLTLGARVGHREETEDRRINDPYDFDTASRATEYVAGTVIRPPKIGDVVRIAGFGQYVDNRVTARSQSPLNDDNYDWDRPQVGYGAELLVNSGKLRGIVDGRHRSYDGEQVARINWAPQFFMNPFPSETDPDFVFKHRWSSFLSGMRHNEVSTRWMIGMPWLPAHVGAEWGYYQEWEWIRPNPSVLQMALPLDVRREGYRFAGGLSLDLADGEGQVAVEVHGARDFREDHLGLVPDVAIERLSYNFGAEYRVFRWLPVRAGVALLRYDPDARDGFPPNKGIRGSAGAGYYWEALDFQIDASYSHGHFQHEPSDPSGEVGYGDQAVLTISRLF